jgi:hypothetical protein
MPTAQAISRRAERKKERRPKVMEGSEWNPPSREAPPRASAIFWADFRRMQGGFAGSEELFIGIRDLQLARRANGRGMFYTGCGADPPDGYTLMSFFQICSFRFGNAWWKFRWKRPDRCCVYCERRP